jgi:hypothetical protein
MQHSITLSPDKALEATKIFFMLHRKFTVMSYIPNDDGSIRLKCDSLPNGIHASISFVESKEGSIVHVEACGEDYLPVTSLPPGWGFIAREIIIAVMAACRVEDTKDEIAVITIAALVAIAVALVTLLP